MNLSYHSVYRRAASTSVSLNLDTVSNRTNNKGDAYGGLRLRIVLVSHLTKDISDAYGGVRLRVVIVSNCIKDVRHHTVKGRSRIANVFLESGDRSNPTSKPEFQICPAH